MYLPVVPYPYQASEKGMEPSRSQKMYADFKKPIQKSLVSMLPPGSHSHVICRHVSCKICGTWDPLLGTNTKHSPTLHPKPEVGQTLCWNAYSVGPGNGTMENM